MGAESIVFSVFLIFTGAAVLAGVALFARQSVLVAYIALGVITGPWCLKLVPDADTVQGIGHVGIIFLLYLLGLNLHPQKLIQMLRSALVVTVLTSLSFAVFGGVFAWVSGFNTTECVLIAAAMMFSSTILGLKLLPTTSLHHQHLGEVIISVLLLQDIAAILVLLGLEVLARENMPFMDGLLLVLALPGLAAVAHGLERFVLRPLIRRFDTIQEYVFLLAIGWCLGIAQLGHTMGLSYEMGAFIAGVSLAASPIATFIAESLKPLRDFFLVMFFFSLGAGVNLPAVQSVLPHAFLLALLMLLIKPWTFQRLLKREHEKPTLAREVGVRLGQMSEFSLLIAVLALDAAVISAKASYLIQAATILTFIASSYLIMMRYPTPISVDDKLRRD